jgi:hypothetical protein
MARLTDFHRQHPPLPLCSPLTGGEEWRRGEVWCQRILRVADVRTSIDSTPASIDYASASVNYAPRVLSSSLGGSAAAP